MKKLILSTALIAISLQGLLFAQPGFVSSTTKQMRKSKTEQTFGINENLIFLRDFIVLKEGRLILDLDEIRDYENFRNLDSLLTDLHKEIAFYKDSLDANPTGNVRIDYVLSEDYAFKKIRFKRYPANGSSFLAKDGAISRLKFEQDTVRIIIQKSRQGIGRFNRPGSCTIPYSIAATFLLGNYYDIDKVVADKVLAGIIDTLQKATGAGKRKSLNTGPTTIVYNPYYSGEAGFKKYDRIMEDEYDFGPNRKARYVSANVNFGAGLVRNTIAPMVDIGLQYNRDMGSGDHNVYRLSVAPYFFFDKDNKGNNIVNDNWFINADLGTFTEDNQYGWIGKAGTFGVGYLAVQKGGYFKNTTFKVFTDIRFIRGLTILPEIILTDNMKQIFPGITVKVF